MKKNKYQHFEEITPELFLHYNAIDNCFLLMKKNKHQIYENSSAEQLEKEYPTFFQELSQYGFLVDSNMNETLFVQQNKEKCYTIKIYIT